MKKLSILILGLIITACGNDKSFDEPTVKQEEIIKYTKGKNPIESMENAFELWRKKASYTSSLLDLEIILL